MMGRNSDAPEGVQDPPMKLKRGDFRDWAGTDDEGKRASFREVFQNLRMDRCSARCPATLS
jgi:hypothetical protein